MFIAMDAVSHTSRASTPEKAKIWARIANKDGVEAANNAMSRRFWREGKFDDTGWTEEAREAAAAARKGSGGGTKNFKSQSEWKTRVRSLHGSGVTFKQQMHPGGGIGSVRAY